MFVLQNKNNNNKKKTIREDCYLNREKVISLYPPQGKGHAEFKWITLISWRNDPGKLVSWRITRNCIHTHDWKILSRNIRVLNVWPDFESRRVRSIIISIGTSSYLISIRPEYFLPVNSRRSDADFSLGFLGDFGATLRNKKRGQRLSMPEARAHFGHEQQRGMLRSCVTDVIYVYVEDKVIHNKYINKVDSLLGLYKTLCRFSDIPETDESQIFFFFWGGGCI